MLSFNCIGSMSNTFDVLATVPFKVDDKILSFEGFLKFATFDGDNFVGGLVTHGELSPSRGYKILYSGAPGAIFVQTGDPQLPVEDVVLYEGRNWIGHAPLMSYGINTGITVVVGETFTIDDQIKTRSGTDVSFATYDGSTFQGRLLELEPGVGYEVKVAQAVMFRYTTSPPSPSRPPPTPQSPSPPPPSPSEPPPPSPPPPSPSPPPPSPPPPSPSPPPPSPSPPPPSPLPYRLAPSGEVRCTGTVNQITNGFMQGGVFPSFLTDSTVPGGGPCSSSPCTRAANQGATLSVVTEASLYGPYSLSFVNSKGKSQFTKTGLPAGKYSVDAATDDVFTFRAFCRAGGASSTAKARMLTSSNLPENGWTGTSFSTSNEGWADCQSSAWTELSGVHTVTKQDAGVRVGFRIDNQGGTILYDGFELLRNPGADEQLDEEECRIAATLYGGAFSVVSSSDRPKGCHYSPEDTSSPAFFYNMYAGMAFSSTAYGGDYLAVCNAFPSDSYYDY